MPLSDSRDALAYDVFFGTHNYVMLYVVVQ